jgi:Transport and Golgi organisation 2
MCTVSIVPTLDGCRVVCNRDERRTRAAARPPRVWSTGASWAVYPQDPESGGTWIGVNGDGLVVALLNGTSTSAAPHAMPRSRGSIVPGLLACTTIARAVQACEALDVRLFEPFRLVMVQRDAVAVVTSDAARPSPEACPLVAPVMFTSSSLGDDVVEVPRRRLFERLVLAADDWLRGQSRFHRHRWRRRPEISVRMSRGDAATVSRTTIDVTSRTVDLEYEALDLASRSAATALVAT